MLNKTTPLNEFITLQRGFDLPRNDREEGCIPVVASTGVAGYHSIAKVTAPGVVIGRSGSIGGGQYITEDFWPLNTTLWVKDFKGHHPRYIYYLLRSIDFQRFNVGTGVPTLNRNHLSSVSVSDLGIEREQEIASILGGLDDKIELNRQTNQTLEKIAQAIFKSWFVDFEPTRAKIIAKEQGADLATQELAAQAIICGAITLEQLEELEQNLEATLQHAINEKLTQDNQAPINAEQLKATAAMFPNELVESELGEIPEGWAVKKVDDVVKRLRPKKRYTRKQVVEFGHVPVYEQGADILLGYHNDAAGFNASPEQPLFIFGDHTCITHLSCEDFDISQNVIPLEGNKYPTAWVYYAIQGKQEFQEYRRHWSEFIIKEIITPSVVLAERYTELVTVLYKQKEQLVRESNALIQIRDALLPKLLSGELSVAENESLEAFYDQCFKPAITFRR